MKPLISYYGGKQRIASRIVEVLNTIPHTVYCEPFFGGGAVFFARPHVKPGNDHHYREAINDKSELLINLYRVARNNPEEFHRLIEWTPYSKAEHSSALYICKQPAGYSDIEKAWAYYVNIQMSFSNQLNAGWGVRLNSRNSAATWHSKRSRIPECLERLEKVHIDCRDALDVIQAWDSPQTLFYLDPPYPSANQGHYGGYTIDGWSLLCECLDNIQGSYVLSNYNQPIEPASAMQKIEIDAIASAQLMKGDRSQEPDQDALGDRSRTEILWVCDRSANMRGSLAPAIRANHKHQLSLF